MFRGVFNGSNGIDESSESSDGGVDMENSGGDGLRRRLVPARGKVGPTLLDVLKTHVSDTQSKRLKERKR